MANIGIFINGKKIDIARSQEVAQTYAVNSFGDISSRNSAYSNTWEAPLTANNKRIFENSEVVVNDSTMPYTRLTCQVYVDGIMVVNGYAELVSAKGNYKVRIYGGNYDFFSGIKPLLLSEIGLDDLNHVWDSYVIASSRSNTSGYIYPLIDYHADSPSAYFPSASRNIDSRTLFPAIFLHTLIDRIITGAGYTKSGALFSNPEYLSIVLPFSRDKFEKKPGANDFKAIKTTSLIVTGLTFQIIPFENDSTGGAFDNGGDYINSYRYVAPYVIKINIFATLIFKVTSGGAGPSATLRFTFRKNSGGTIVNDITISQANNSTATHVISTGVITLNAGEYIWLTTTSRAGSEVMVGSFMKSQTFPAIEWGGAVLMASTLPKFKQGDIFKCMLQKFSAIAQVDNENKIVYVKQFSEIVDNIPNAIDWSHKIDESEETELTFKMDKYARLNNFIYKEDDGVLKPTGTDYQLSIDNDNLPAEAELVTSLFSASEEIKALIGLSTIGIKLLTAGAFASNKVQPRIAVLRQIDIQDGLGDINYTSPTLSTISVNDSVPLCSFVGQDFNLDWTSLIGYYGQEMQNVLQNTKVIKELIRLNSVDINQLNFFIPIWLDKHKAYFFISEISQFKFTSAESTEVELVKLI